MKDPLSILRAAYALISDRKQWTQGTIARTANGLEVNPHHPLAASWCALGAIYRVCGAEVEIASSTEIALPDNAREAIVELGKELPEFVGERHLSCGIQPLARVSHANDRPGGYGVIDQAFYKAIDRLAAAEGAPLVETVEEPVRELVLA